MIPLQKPAHSFPPSVNGAAANRNNGTGQALRAGAHVSVQYNTWDFGFSSANPAIRQFR